MWDNKFWSLRIFLLICQIWLCFSCEEPFPELPAETQTGAQTFGCLVNNELVFERGRGYYNIGRVSADYYTETDRLEITATCQFDQQFIFHIDHPQKRNEMKIGLIRYLPPNSTQWIEVKDADWIRFTRFDTDSYGAVVSGTFSFDFPRDGKTIPVRKGRFDLKMSVR